MQKTSKEEICALIGLLYLAGIYKSGRQNIYDLWSRDGTGVELFHTVMSVSKFRFLQYHIIFDDKSTRNERPKSDKLAPMREVFQMLIKKCQECCSISSYAIIDEKLKAFRGRCGFRQHIPSKPNKYGIKIFALVDSSTYYTSYMKVFVGLQPEGPYRVSNSPGDVVERLCSQILGTGRNTTIGNWFTSYELAQTMLKKNITLVRTLRKNKRQISPQFVSNKNRSPNTSLFGFGDNCTLVSYIPRKNKNVLLLLTMHRDNKIDENTGVQQKPEIVTFYNATKGGVDSVDQMCSTYNCARNTKRWPRVIFYSLLNVAGINAFIIYSKNENPRLNRRQFLKNLCLELVDNYLKKRTTIATLPKQLRQKVIAAAGSAGESEQPRNGKRARSYDCDQTDRKIKYFREFCYKYLCLEHAKIVCSHSLNRASQEKRYVAKLA